MKNEKQRLAALRSWGNKKVRARRISSIRKAMQRIPQARRVEISMAGVKARLRKMNDPKYAREISKINREAQLKRYSDPEKRKRHREACLKAHSKPSWIRNVREANSRVHPNNYFITQEAAEKSSRRMKRLWGTLEGRRELRVGEFLPEEARKSIAAKQAKRITEQAKPNVSELLLNSILKNYFPGMFRLNVKNGKRIGGKVPDFIDEVEKVVVEMFGVYWHGEQRIGRSRRVEEALRHSHFRSYGYRCAVIWQDELPDVMKGVRKVISVLTG